MSCANLELSCFAIIAEELLLIYGIHEIDYRAVHKELRDV